MSTTINTNDLIWSGVLTTAGDGTMTTDTSKTLATTIERVRPIPGHNLTITTTIAAAIGTTGAILVQGHLTTITSGLATTVAHDVDRSPHRGSPSTTISRSSPSTSATRLTR